MVVGLATGEVCGGWPACKKSLGRLVRWGHLGVGWLSPSVLVVWVGKVGVSAVGVVERILQSALRGE